MSPIASIQIPVAPPKSISLQRHIEAQLSDAEATALEMIRAGLIEKPQRFASTVPGQPGRYVNHERGAELIRWLLQKVAIAVKSEAGQQST